jgi:two-component sensor histidine kinase
VGKPQTGPDVAKVGLGTSIVNALAQQLDARVDLVTGEGGTSVSISHVKTFVPIPEPRDSATDQVAPHTG